MSPPLPEGRAAWLAHHVLPHEPALRHWLARRVVGRMEIEDLVQEAYAILVELESVAHIRQPRQYLFTVARSVLLQQVRRSQVVSIEAVGDIERLGVPDDAPLPEHRAAAMQELDRVSDMIDALPEKCRQAFVLRRVQGLPQREIAQRMQISENTVEKHICRAIRLLMDAMGSDVVDKSSAGGGAASATRKQHAGT